MKVGYFPQRIIFLKFKERCHERKSDTALLWCFYMKKILYIFCNIAFYCMGFVGIIILTYKGIVSYSSTPKIKDKDNLNIIDTSELVSNDLEQLSYDSAYLNIVNKTDAVSKDDPNYKNDKKEEDDIFPIIVEMNKEKIEIMDYYFDRDIPDDSDFPGEVLSAFMRFDDGNDFDENGAFNGNYVFLVMHVKVTNKLNEAYEYQVNDVSVKFGVSPDSPGSFLNELFFSTAQQSDHPVTGMHYLFKPNETYEANYYFWIFREFFENEDEMCLLVFNDNGSYVLDEDDTIIVLDKNRICYREYN